jgi:Ca2+-binding EF-hand superfamily protein
MSEEVETMRRAVNGHAQNVAELEAGLQTERCAREGAEKQTSELSATRADLAEVQDSLAQSRVHCEAVERQQEAAERETEQLRAQLAELARSSQEKTAALQARAAEDVSALGAANDRIAARMAESYGSAMVPREWLAAVLEQMQAHGGAHAAQTAALTKLLFAAQQKDAESQQLLVDTLRLADRHRAATKIQVAFLRHVRRASECTASQGATSLAQADVELQRTVRAFNQASEELGSAHEQLGHTAWRSAQLEQCLGRTASYHTRHRAAGTIQTAVRGRMYRTTSGKLREQRQRLEAHVATLTEQLEADWRRSDALEVRLQLRGEHVAALTLAAAEAARTLAAAEAARTLAEAEARKQGAEAQAQEQARSEAEEAARLATEETEEARRVAAEQEVARLSAEERVARASADAQVARVNAMEQVTRVAAEEKAKRLAVEANAREQVEQAHLAMVVLAEPPAVEELEEDHSDSTEGGELLALLCSSTSELAQSVLEKEALQLYARINRNVDGFLSRSELIRALRSDLQLQSSLELPSSIREGQMQSFERIFRQMDIDDKRGISAGEFVEYVLATWIAHSAPTAPAPQPKPIDPPGTPDGGRPQQKQLVVPVMTPDSSSSVASEDDEETLLYYNGRCLTPSRRGAHAAAMGRSHRAESTTSVTGGSSVSTLLFDESMSSEDSDQQPMDLQRTSTEEFHHSRRSLMSIIAPESKSQDAKGLSSIGELKAQLKQSAAELESVTEALGMLAQEAQATTSTTGGHGPHMIDHYTVDRPGVILAEFYSEQQRQMRGGSWRASHDRLRVAIRDLATEVADSQAHKRALQTQLLQQQNASQVAATSLRALEAKLADARTQAFALQGAARPMLEARADARTAVAAMEVRMRLKDEEVERMQADMEQWKIAQEAQRYEEIAELESMHKTQYEQTRLQKVGSLQAELELSAIRHLFHKLASEHPNQLDCAGFAVALEHMRGQQQDAAAARAFFKQLEKDKDDCISMSTFIRFWRSFKVDNGSQLLAATSNDAQKTVKVADESAVAAAADLCVQRIFASIELRGDSVEKLINYRQFISWQSQLREAHTGGHHISDEELQATMVIWHEAADASSRRGVIDGHVDWTGMIEVIQQMLKNEVIRITAGGHVLPMVDALGMDETRPRKRGKTGFAESLIAAAGTAAGAQSSQAGATATSSQPIARPTALHGIFGDIHTAVSLLSSGLRSHEDAIQRQREEIHRRREIEQQQRQALVTEEQEQVQQQSELATEMQQLAESAERAVTEKLLQQAVELAATQVKQETRLRSVEAERDRARESAARHAAVATAWARAHPYGASPEEAAEGQASGCSLEESTEFELTPMEQLEQRLVQDMLADSGYDEEEEAKEVEDDDLSQFDAYVAEMAILRSLEAATDDLQPQPGATGDPEAEAEGGGDGSSRREAALLLLDRCRRVLGRAGAPRRGTGVGARLAEIEAALAASAASAHWLIAVRAELERRAAALQEPNYLDAAARVRLLRDRSATRIQSTLRGFLTRCVDGDRRGGSGGSTCETGMNGAVLCCAVQALVFRAARARAGVPRVGGEAGGEPALEHGTFYTLRAAGVR